MQLIGCVCGRRGERFTDRVTETFSKETAKEGDHDIKGVTYVAKDENVIARETHLYLGMCPFVCLEVNEFPLILLYSSSQDSNACLALITECHSHSLQTTQVSNATSSQSWQPWAINGPESLGVAGWWWSKPFDRKADVAVCFTIGCSYLCNNLILRNVITPSYLPSRHSFREAISEGLGAFPLISQPRSQKTRFSPWPHAVSEDGYLLSCLLEGYLVSW